jgi:serine O-acetyltransferase
VSLIRDTLRDLTEMARVSTKGDVSARSVAQAMLQDSAAVLALSRVRTAASGLHLGPVNRLLRVAQTALYGIEIGKDVKLGEGVYFVHTVGIVLGGDSVIGNRVKFMGSNTVGTAKDNGYPVIEDDVVVGVGARILGPVRIGARAVIGANAVVLQDVPADGLAVGVPATVRRRGDGPPPELT